MSLFHVFFHKIVYAFLPTKEHVRLNLQPNSDKVFCDDYIYILTSKYYSEINTTPTFDRYIKAHILLSYCRCFYHGEFSSMHIVASTA